MPPTLPLKSSLLFSICSLRMTWLPVSLRKWKQSGASTYSYHHVYSPFIICIHIVCPPVTLDKPVMNKIFSTLVLSNSPCSFMTLLFLFTGSLHSHQSTHMQMYCYFSHLKEFFFCPTFPSVSCFQYFFALLCNTIPSKGCQNLLTSITLLIFFLRKFFSSYGTLQTYTAVEDK